jgi:FkbM family methyltransferase
MLVNRNDINQANALFKTGHAVDHNDIAMLSQILQKLGGDLTVLDIGANFGTYSVALARIVGSNGSVHAFEPQRLIYNLLVGSVALNGFTNVYCHNIALGNVEGRVEIPQYDYNKPMNFGSIEFGRAQSEKLTQTRGTDPAKAEYVRLATIDSFIFPKAHLIKIDVEGMEVQVLHGSAQTIRRCRPILFVEHLKSDRDSVRDTIANLDYVVYQRSMNFLGIPKELGGKIRIPVNSPEK